MVDASDYPIPIYNSRNYQSLLALHLGTEKRPIIYNSRNYQSLLALLRYHQIFWDLQQQKLLELTSRCPILAKHFLYLQQQKLLELTSLKSPVRRPNTISTIVEIIRAYQPLKRKNYGRTIYNSRNYQSLLANPLLMDNYVVSTIVEIIRAYQP